MALTSEDLTAIQTIVRNETEPIKADLETLARATNEQFVVVLDRLDAMDLRFDGIDRRLDAMDARFDAIDRRLDGIDRRLDAMDARFDAMDLRFDAMDTRFDAMDIRFDRVEAGLGDVQSTIRFHRLQPNASK